MIVSAEKLFTRLQTRLGRTGGLSPCLNQIEECFVVCNSTILALSKRIKKKGFTCHNEEILFFKSVKPRFVSLQRFYVLLYNHVLFLPDDQEEQLRYLERSLHKLDRLLAEHNEFYCYFQSGSSHLDNEYFLRTADSYVSTPGEILISEIMAYKELAAYIQEEIKKLQSV